VPKSSSGKDENLVVEEQNTIQWQLVEDETLCSYRTAETKAQEVCS
jgi:hypothetical protein